jgi:uncharacterized protein YacL
MGLRIGLLVIGMVCGLALGWEFYEGRVWVLGISAAVGGISGWVILALDQKLRTVPFSINFWGGIGLVSGLVVAGLVVMVLHAAGGASASLFFFPAKLLALLGIPFWGLSMGMHFGKLGTERMATPTESAKDPYTPKLLDTSVIIDGRIADLCETGFIEGSLVVPQFILLELQQISDSSDGLKRARGRRGLDILNVIQKMANLNVNFVEDDFPHVKEVDTKLIELAKKMDAKILTNDFNLNKVAGLQGVKILNINDLCNALKPVVLPGEAIRVLILKEGKESGQGVAYLDDGTMVVVDHAKRWIGKNVDVIVTSVLQTSAGRMIFTRLKEETEREELSFARV